MNTVLFLNAIIGFSESPFLVFNYIVHFVHNSIDLCFILEYIFDFQYLTLHTIVLILCTEIMATSYMSQPFRIHLEFIAAYLLLT